MTECNHTTLELLPSRKRALRCRQCHLTLDPEEAADGHCPECFERSGKRYRDFEELEPSGDGAATYRCETCGVIVKCP
jgi:rubrerythrin